MEMSGGRAEDLEFHAADDAAFWRRYQRNVLVDGGGDVGELEEGAHVTCGVAGARIPDGVGAAGDAIDDVNAAASNQVLSDSTAPLDDAVVTG